MITLARTDEHTFTSIESLREFLATRSCRDWDVRRRQISLNENGVLRADQFEGPLSEPALRGLLRVLDIPEAFGTEICPPDLLARNVNRLAEGKDDPVRVRVVDGIVTSVMAANRLPITHDLLLRSIDLKQPIQEATISGTSLRITAANGESEEVLPGDNFVSGWDLVNGEDGWLPTEARVFILRVLCTNGMVQVDQTSLFFRNPSSKEPIFKALDALKSVLAAQRQPLVLTSAIRWAAQRQLSGDRDAALAFLARRLGGAAILPALNDLTAESSFYDLLNRVTSLARTHRLEARRHYEAEGGVLLGWFSGQGRRRAPWHRSMCQHCLVRDLDGSKQATASVQDIGG